MTTTKILLALLGAQILLGALTWWPEDRSVLQPHPLLELEPDSLQEITITRKPLDGEEPDPVRLVRSGEGWEVASAGSYPAAPDKVADLVDHLVGLEVRAPIATQATSYDALKVGDDEYGRRVSIRSDDREIELVVGAAASKSIHVRVEGQPEVYEARGLSEWSLRDRGASYYDSQYVEVDAEKLLTFSVHRESGDLLFTRGESGWQLDGLPAGSELDLEAVDRFIEDATSIRLTQPVGRENDASYALDSGVRVEWSYEDGEQTVAGGFQIGNADGSDSYIKELANDFIVKASNTKLDPLRDKQADDFAKNDAG